MRCPIITRPPSILRTQLLEVFFSKLIKMYKAFAVGKYIIGLIQLEEDIKIATL